MDKFMEQIYRTVPAAAIITGTESLRVYEWDALSPYRVIPRCVVLPDSISEVLAIMRLCHAERVPVVARGAGTGLSGGALPVADGIILSLAKFNRIIAIDPLQRIARVQPGVRNLSVSEAAAPSGLFFAPDP